VGDKVTTFPGHSQGDYPAYGEWAIMPATSVAHYPAELSEVEAASFGTAYLTGYFALIEMAKLASGQTVLVTAASSSTGLAAIEIAKSVGAKVIATTRTSQKGEALRNAGADMVVNRRRKSCRARSCRDRRQRRRRGLRCGRREAAFDTRANHQIARSPDFVRRQKRRGPAGAAVRSVDQIYRIPSLHDVQLDRFRVPGPDAQ
jgi:NADPH:quinone reductase-like Zn-dependent oxidoreductase